VLLMHTNSKRCRPPPATRFAPRTHLEPRLRVVAHVLTNLRGGPGNGVHLAASGTRIGQPDDAVKPNRAHQINANGIGHPGADECYPGGHRVLQQRHCDWEVRCTLCVTLLSQMLQLSGYERHGCQKQVAVRAAVTRAMANVLVWRLQPHIALLRLLHFMLV
jgi:hypothetical protein